MNAQPTAIVRMENICKHFGGITALDGVTVDLFPGEVVGVLGHNGAGKSTLIKILAGAIPADSGDVFIDGRKVQISSPTDARRYGVETIYQELALCGNLDPAANLFMGRERHTFGFLRNRSMQEETRKVLDGLGIRLKSLTGRVDRLSGGQRQSIAIGRSVHFNARVIIMDEPTAALGMEETRMVIDLINELKAKGIGIFLISHDIHDVYRFTDRVSILNGGRLVVTGRTTDFTQDEIVEMIISGRPVRRTQ